MRRRSIMGLVAATVCLCVAAPAGALAQAPKESELKAEVPALTAMHEVIMPMWHDAWPKKDAAALAGFVRDLEKHASAIAKAELPGILRDKTGAWQDGVASLKASVAAYRSAVEAEDNEALLKAAERVHTDYETLVKVVRPLLKEINDFHASLYVLYHYQLDPLDVAGVTETVKALQAKAAALNAASLPDRLKSRQQAFDAQRARLAKAVDAVAAALADRDEAKLRETIELLHVEYEKLEKVFG